MHFHQPARRVQVALPVCDAIGCRSCTLDWQARLPNRSTWRGKTYVSLKLAPIVIVVIAHVAIIFAWLSFLQLFLHRRQYSGEEKPFLHLSGILARRRQQLVCGRNFYPSLPTSTFPPQMSYQGYGAPGYGAPGYGRESRPRSRHLRIIN